MRFRTAVCIYNPASGKGLRRRTRRKIRDALARSAESVEMVSTSHPGHAGQLARRAAAVDCDLLAILSGDGTVNEVLQGIAGLESPALLVLPAGTANVLAHEVGLPLSPVRAAAALPQLQACSVQLGQAHFERTGTSRYFLLMCGAGFDASVVMRTSDRRKRWLGEAEFALAGAGLLSKPLAAVRVEDPIAEAASPPPHWGWLPRAGCTAGAWCSRPMPTCSRKTCRSCKSSVRVARGSWAA